MCSCRTEAAGELFGLSPSILLVETEEFVSAGDKLVHTTLQASGGRGRPWSRGSL